MSVVDHNEVGWIVDHCQEINNAYAVTYKFEYYRLLDYVANGTDCVSEKRTAYSVYQFEAAPELFAIYGTYMMDSQFSKYTKKNQISVTSDPVMKSFDMTTHKSVVPSVLQLPTVNVFSVVFYVIVCKS